MAQELGEIAVNVKEEGTQDALGNMADGSADAEGQQGGGGMGAAGIGEQLGSLGSTLGKILGLLAVLSQLKVITELASGLLRAVNLALLPLAALLLTFLRPLFQELLQFIGSIDFQTTLDEFLRKADVLVTNLIREFRGMLDKLIPFVNIDETQPNNGKDFNQFTTIDPENNPNTREGPFGSVITKDSISEDILIQMGWLNEKSNSSQDESIAETTTSETRNGGAGGS